MLINTPAYSQKVFSVRSVVYFNVSPFFCKIILCTVCAILTIDFKITITDEDGNEFEVEVLSTVEYNGASYMAVIPADGEDDLRLEVSILKSVEEDGEPLLCAIDDEAELQAVYDLVMDSLYDEQ